MNRSKIIAGTFLVGICLTAFTMFKLKPITTDSIRNKFFTSLFDRYATGDTSIFYLEKSEYEDDPYKMYANAQCQVSPTFVSYILSEGLDTAWTNFAPEVRTRFKTLFGGLDIVKSKVKLPTKDYDGNDMYWNQFNGLALKAAFDKLYQKPTATFRGIGLQKLYNFSMKDLVRDVADVAVKINANKAAFDAQAKLYFTKATTDENFDGLSFSEEATKKLLPNYNGSCLGDYYHQRVVSTMLRRQIDGSLPILLTCLKTVLKDYDLEYYNKVALKF